MTPAKTLIILGLAASLLPWTTPGLALILGAALGLTLGNPWPDTTNAWSKKLLQVVIVGLGFGLEIGIVLTDGARAIPYTAVGIAATLLLGWILHRAIRPNRDTSALVTVGTAICGGSAIAALAPVLKADGKHTGVALATVFALNAVGLLAFPFLGRWLELDQSQFGLWAAIAIHDTSSVVGAAAQYGEEALELATTVKLTRALWIIPMVLIASAIVRSEGKAKFPLFLLGFVAAASLRAFVPAASELWNALEAIASRLLVTTIFLIGCGLTRDVLSKVGPRPLVLGVLLWIAVASGTLAAIELGWIAAR